MKLVKYVYYTKNKTFQEYEMDILEERDDRYWVEDAIGVRTISKAEINHIVTNPVSDSIRVYTKDGKEKAIQLMMEYYQKQIQLYEMKIRFYTKDGKEKAIQLMMDYYQKQIQSYEIKLANLREHIQTLESETSIKINETDREER